MVTGSTAINFFHQSIYYNLCRLYLINFKDRHNDLVVEFLVNDIRLESGFISR